MAAGGAGAAACGRWQRGLDCGFGEDRFHVAALAVWALTALALLAAAVLRWRRGRSAPSGASRQCLLLSAASAACCALDNVGALAFGGPWGAPWGGYGYGALSLLGSAMLVFALRVFAHLWADIAGALHSLECSRETDGPAQEVPRKGGSSVDAALRLVRSSHDAIAVAHIPFAVVMAASVCGWGPHYGDMIWAWTGWCFLSACCAPSLLALLMWLVVRHLGESIKTTNLRCVTLINLCEQVLFNVLLLPCILLSCTSAYRQYGAVQGLVFGLAALLLWLAHAQVLAFFAVCKPSDPLYSCQELEALVTEGAIAPWTPRLDSMVPQAPARKAVGTILGGAPVALALGKADSDLEVSI